eukprot:3584083-Alexandrium_andersonii.AAC.1
MERAPSAAGEPSCATRGVAGPWRPGPNRHRAQSRWAWPRTAMPAADKEPTRLAAAGAAAKSTADGASSRPGAGMRSERLPRAAVLDPPEERSARGASKRGLTRGSREYRSEAPACRSEM